MSEQLYSTGELLSMNPEELRVAQANGFVKPGPASPSVYRRLSDVPLPDEDVVELPASEAPGYQVMGSAPANPYAPTEWGNDLYDFRVPSGQLCQMRKLRPENVMHTGLLDKITRLPALAEEQVHKAQGLPPDAQMPTKEQLAQVIAVVNEMLPLVVVQPVVCPDDTPAEERPVGSVLVSDIELFDRIAIMNRATQGVAKLDNFRQQS